MNHKTKLQRAIRRLVRAEVNYSWKGGGDPENIPYLTQELKLARKAVRAAIESLIQLVPCPYTGIAYSRVPGYVSGYGCPVCKGIGIEHLTVEAK